MKVRMFQWALMLATVLLFSGCSTFMKSDSDGSSDGAGVSESGDASTSGASQRGNWQGNPLENPDSVLYTKVIYFDFDMSDIRQESIPTLRAHAEYLISNPAAAITVEGHADERGSREYNIGLGERRASTIKRFMEAEGVSPGQINTISYGEERPADPGHGESAWAMNRRGVLAY